MANVLEILPTQWQQLRKPNPDNVLILPNLRQPIGPIVQPTASLGSYIFEMNDLSRNCGPSDQCQAIYHDSISGWWFKFAEGPCGTNENRLTCAGSPITFEEWAQGLIDGINLAGCDPTVVGIPAEGTVPDAWTWNCTTAFTYFLQWQFGFATCPPGFGLDINGQCIRSDPPVPRGLLNIAGISRSIDRTQRPGLPGVLMATDQLSSTQLLNPTLRPQTPFNMSSCGCGGPAVTEEVALDGFDDSPTPSDPTINPALATAFSAQPTVRERDMVRRAGILPQPVISSASGPSPIAGRASLLGQVRSRIGGIPGYSSLNPRNTPFN